MMQHKQHHHQWELRQIAEEGAARPVISHHAVETLKDWHTLTTTCNMRNRQNIQICDHSKSVQTSDAFKSYDKEIWKFHFCSAPFACFLGTNICGQGQPYEQLGWLLEAFGLRTKRLWWRRLLRGSAAILVSFEGLPKLATKELQTNRCEKNTLNTLPCLKHKTCWKQKQRKWEGYTAANRLH